MSIAGRIRTRGTDCAVRRPSTEETDTGERQTWAAAGTVRLLLEPIASEVAQHVFGTEHRVTLRAYAIAADALAELGDGVVVASGAHAGSYRVRGLVPAHRVGAGAHQELGLVSTPEAMTVST
jgi:hypothetical protein